VNPAHAYLESFSGASGAGSAQENPPEWKAGPGFDFIEAEKAL